MGNVVGLAVLLIGLAGCATATDWSSLAVAPALQADMRAPGVSAMAGQVPGVMPGRADGFSLCEAAVQAAELREQTPAGLLGAIARVETGRPDPRTHVIRPWPWSVDVDGQSHFYGDRDQAIAGVQQALAAGAGSVDVGCLQVNLQYHPTAFGSLQEAFDPTANAAYAARFLKSLWVATPGRQWMVAAGYYHSRTPDLAAEYRRHVQGFGGVSSCKPAPEGSLVLRAPDPLVVAADMVLAPPATSPRRVCATLAPLT